MLDKEHVHHKLSAWFAEHARPLPWRAYGTTAWGVLVSEIMSQQTPVARVEGPWREWMRRWPSPRDLAAADTAEILRAWGRLGYPRRALRLAETAQIIATRHGNQVPADEELLLALPGVGNYTAAAVLAFAFQRRSLVLDTNIRRVLARMSDGVEYPPSSETRAERCRAEIWLPEEDVEAAKWSAAVMELGALVCTAKTPDCDACPLRDSCAWMAAGRPAWTGPARRGQSWSGTDRQCRGRIMAALRAADGPLLLAEVSWPDRAQLTSCAVTLVQDGLAHGTPECLRLGPASNQTMGSKGDPASFGMLGTGPISM